MNSGILVKFLTVDELNDKSGWPRSFPILLGCDLKFTQYY